jgi:hypothetical protein
MKALPYSSATAGAYGEIERLLRGFGCRNFGVMNDWADGKVMVQFEHRGRMVSVHASWHGYARLWKLRHPKASEQACRKAGEKAVPSILRDWIKGQITAIEVGLMPFDQAFMPHMLCPDGTPLIKHVEKLLLPAPK